MEPGTAHHRSDDDADAAQPRLAELRNALSEACGETPDWRAKVAAAVYAGIEFAIDDPDRALALLASNDTRSPSESTIDYLDALLGRTAPAGDGGAGGGTGAVRAIAMIVQDHLRAGRADELREIGPALVQFALQPYLRFTEAKLWADGGPA